MSPWQISQAQLPVRVFPLIRRISARVTPALAALDLIWVLLPLGAVRASNMFRRRPQELGASRNGVMPCAP